MTVVRIRLKESTEMLKERKRAVSCVLLSLYCMHMEQLSERAVPSASSDRHGAFRRPMGRGGTSHLKELHPLAEWGCAWSSA